MARGCSPFALITLGEAAAQMGITTSGAAKLEAKALAKLRKGLLDIPEMRERLRPSAYLVCDKRTDPQIGGLGPTG